MAVLFLDFDGVVHPDPCGEAEKFCRLALVEQVLREFEDVEVVISSAWRLELADLPLERQLKSLCRHFSADIRPRVVGVTPNLWAARLWLREDDLGHHREDECRAWLQAHRPGLEAWIAVDDRGHWFQPDCAQLLLVEDPSVGFTEEHARKLRARLAAMTAPRKRGT
jgi:hypothetical protein